MVLRDSIYKALVQDGSRPMKTRNEASAQELKWTLLVRTYNFIVQGCKQTNFFFGNTLFGNAGQSEFKKLS